MQLMRVLSSPFIGNTIGFISLFVGAFSLAWTIKTFRMTKMIEKKLPKAQAKAINNMRFKEYRTYILKKIETYQKAVIKAEVVSKQTINYVIVICNRLKGYDTLIAQDVEAIERINNKAKSLKQNEIQMKNEGTTEFIELTTGLINILEKGEYDL